jgi:multidrug efflux pump subunit AcrB
MIARFLFRYPRYLILLLLSIIFIGLMSYSQMARQEDPTITSFVATLQTVMPGASPERVEQLVSKPIEDTLREIPEVTEITSTSSLGLSLVKVEVDYHLSPEEMDRVWTEIRDEIGDLAASFPPGTSVPELDDDLLRPYVKIIAITEATSGSHPTLLGREAKAFADAARRVPYTRSVRAFGLPEEEIAVAIDEEQLTLAGLTVRDVWATIAQGDTRIPSGRLSSEQGNLTVELAGEYKSTEDLAALVVQTTPSGQSVRLQDIATLTKTERMPPLSVAISQGKRSVLIAVEMERGYQVDRYSEQFDAFLTAYQQTASAGVTIETAYDQSGYTNARLATVANNLLVGIALVIMVLMVTLGWRAALVVALILPLCTLLSMIVLRYLEVPIHQMSVTGLVVALGLLVDGSIVMVDECRKRLLEGLRALDAILGSVSRLRIPLISSTLTTILAFTPMAILPGPAGNFVGSIAVAVIVMLSSSLFLALAVTPVLAARLMPGGLRADERWWHTGLVTPRLRGHFVASLNWSIRHPGASVALALILPLTGFISAGALTNQFFPATDRDQFFIQVALPQGSAIEQTLALAYAIDARLHKEPLIRRVDWTVGSSPPPFYYNVRSFKDRAPYWAEALVLTTDQRQTDALIRSLQTVLDQTHPDAQIIVRGLDQGPPVEAPIEVEIIGNNLATLKTLGEQLRARLEQLPQITHTKTSMNPGGAKLKVDFDEQRLAQLNVSRQAVAEQFDLALSGRIASDVFEGTERLPIRVRLASQDWNTANDLQRYSLPLPGTSRTVPLTAIATISLAPEASPISRKNGERVNRVQGYLTRGILPEEALKQLQRELGANPISLPEGYRIAYGGDSDERAMVINELIAPLGMVTAGLLITIILTFNAYRLSAIALFVTLCSFGLSLFSLEILHYPLGINALIGVIGSIGVSINAAIIIMTALQQHPGASRCVPDSIVEVIVDSSRHIISTTITTFGGFLPLILEGSNFWPPFAVAIAGGVLLSTIISFYLVPPLFYLAYRRSKAGTETSVGAAAYER